LVFDIDIKHFAVSSKDRTGLFMGKPEFIISNNTGLSILQWCNQGSLQIPLAKNDIINKINYCNNLAELLALYKQYPEYQESLKSQYEDRKSFLIQLSNPNNYSTNGHSK